MYVQGSRIHAHFTKVPQLLALVAFGGGHQRAFFLGVFDISAVETASFELQVVLLTYWISSLALTSFFPFFPDDEEDDVT